MHIRNLRDLIGGGALVALGVFVSLYAAQTMPLGTLNRMGPGLMPFALGWMLAGFGLLTVINGLVVAAPMPRFALRPFVTVIGAILAFALVARPFGIVVAVAAVLGVSVLAELRVTRVQFLVMLLALPTVSWLIFSYGLGVPLPLFNWPL